MLQKITLKKIVQNYGLKYTKKKKIKDLDKEIAFLKPNDKTGEEIGNLIYTKLSKNKSQWMK